MPNIEELLNPDGTLDVAKLELTTKLPFGDYEVKLADIKNTETKDNKPQLEATFEVLGGPQQGRTFRYWYTLDVQAPQEAGGKVRARGIADIVTHIRNVGGDIKSVPWQKPNEMRKLYAMHMGKKRLQVSLTERVGTGAYAGNSYTNLRVKGVAGTAPAIEGQTPTASTTDDLA